MCIIPIAHCGCSNCGEAARLILAHGADIDSKDGRQNTATMAAGALGHYEVLEVLLEHHLLNLHAGVRISGVITRSLLINIITLALVLKAYLHLVE